MNSTKTNNTGDTTTRRGHDRRAIKSFLLHVAGELQAQYMDLARRPLPPKLAQGLRQFRVKYGTSLFPPAEVLGEIADAPDGDDEQGDLRQEQMYRRNEQFECVLAVLELLGELTLQEDVLQVAG